MIAGLWARVGTWLAAAGAIIVALAAVFLRGRTAGRTEAEQEELRARVRGAQERGNADADAAAAADPVGELRARGWVRNVEADHGTVGRWLDERDRSTNSRS